jgi:hypothetical protein
VADMATRVASILGLSRRDIETEIIRLIGHYLRFAQPAIVWFAYPLQELQEKESEK